MWKVDLFHKSSDQLQVEEWLPFFTLSDSLLMVSSFVSDVPAPFALAYPSGCSEEA